MDGSVRTPKLKYPELFSFAKKNNISISNALVDNLPNHLFHLPLSALAFLQLQALRRNLEDLNVNEENDLWTYTWDQICRHRIFVSVPRTQEASRKGLLDGAIDPPSFSAGMVNPAHPSRDVLVNLTL